MNYYDKNIAASKERDLEICTENKRLNRTKKLDTNLDFLSYNKRKASAYGNHVTNFPFKCTELLDTCKIK